MKTKLRELSPQEREQDPLLVAVHKLLVEYNLDWDFERKEVIEYVKEI